MASEKCIMVVISKYCTANIFLKNLEQNKGKKPKSSGSDIKTLILYCISFYNSPKYIIYTVYTSVWLTTCHKLLGKEITLMSHNLNF